MAIPKLKLIETDSKLIEAVSTCLYDDRGNWYYMPYWFRKVSEGVYEIYDFNDLPQELKSIIRSERDALKHHLFPEKEKDNYEQLGAPFNLM